MRRTTLFFAITFLFGSLNAVASGSSVRGGGNTVNQLLVEDYAIHSTELPNFDEVDKYLHLFGARVPDFARKMRAIAYPAENDLNSVQWYYIPQKIQELPSSITGLAFSSDQMAFQQGGEIFISETDLRKLDRTVKGRLYLHEVLMMSRADKDVSAVRKMMTFLKRKNDAPTANELSSALAQLGFGTFTPNNDGGEVDKQECGSSDVAGVDGRMKDCRSLPGSMKTTNAGIVWRLVSRTSNQSTGIFYEVWMDTRTKLLWGDTLDKLYRYEDAVKDIPGRYIGKQLACQSEDGMRANANISEGTFRMALHFEFASAIDDGIQEIFPTSGRSYWIHGDLFYELGKWVRRAVVESEGKVSLIDAGNPQSIRCVSLKSPSKIDKKEQSL